MHLLVGAVALLSAEAVASIVAPTTATVALQGATVAHAEQSTPTASSGRSTTVSAPALARTCP